MEKASIYGYMASELDGSEQVFDQVFDNLPESYSYIEYLPKVVNQGQYPVCVPCSLSAHLNWNYNVDHQTDNTVDNHIKYFDIYRSKTSAGDGMSFKDALHFLQHTGVNTDNGPVKIEKYAMVNSIEALKTALIMNGPCVGGMMVLNNTGVAEFWNEKYKVGNFGGHAISIAGYTPAGFIIRNSWGSHFGNNGYVILPYDSFNKLMEIWTIID